MLINLRAFCLHGARLLWLYMHSVLLCTHVVYCGRACPVMCHSACIPSFRLVRRNCWFACAVVRLGPPEPAAMVCFVNCNRFSSIANPPAGLGTWPNHRDQMNSARGASPVSPPHIRYDAGEAQPRAPKHTSRGGVSPPVRSAPCYAAHTPTVATRHPTALPCAQQARTPSPP